MTDRHAMPPGNLVAGFLAAAFGDLVPVYQQYAAAYRGVITERLSPRAAAATVSAAELMTHLAAGAEKLSIGRPATAEHTAAALETLVATTLVRHGRDDFAGLENTPIRETATVAWLARIADGARRDAT